MKDKPKWETEPYSHLFKHAGLLCFMKRHPELGHWCGYVATPTELDNPESNMDVHGGATFYEFDKDLEEWVVGFDCAHLGDLIPKIQDTFSRREGNGDVYRDKEYVIEQTKKLAEQVASR